MLADSWELDSDDHEEYGEEEEEVADCIPDECVEEQKQSSALDEVFLSQLRGPSPASSPKLKELTTMDFLVLDIVVQHDLVYGTSIVLFGRASDGRFIPSLLLLFLP